MPALSIHTHGDECWPDLNPIEERLADGRVIHLVGTGLSMARMPEGLASGKSSVTIRVDLPDGRVVLAETSLALLSTAVRAFEAADEREGRPT